jgi:hypothetical protein
LWPRELKRWLRPEMNLVIAEFSDPGPEGDPSTVIALRGGVSSSPLRYVEHNTQLQPWKPLAAAEPLLGGTKSHVHLLLGEAWLMEYYLRLCVKRVGAVGGAAREPRERPTKIDKTPASQHNSQRQPIASSRLADPLYWCLLVSEDRQPDIAFPARFSYAQARYV